MKAFLRALPLALILAACTNEKPEPASSAPAPAEPVPTASAAEPAPETSSDAGDSEDEPVQGVWSGQVRIDAQTGLARLDHIGAESGDYVPMRFRRSSEVGVKILATCADEDLCEVEGTVRFLDEPPPENASAVGEIISVDRVKKLPPDAR